MKHVAATADPINRPTGVAAPGLGSEVMLTNATPNQPWLQDPDNYNKVNTQTDVILE